MKLRLESAPLTVEDKRIWNRLADRRPEGVEWFLSTQQDRRDADLMWVWRRYLEGAGISSAEWVDFCQGWDYVGPSQWMELYDR